MIRDNRKFIVLHWILPLKRGNAWNGCIMNPIPNCLAETRSIINLNYNWSQRHLTVVCRQLHPNVQGNAFPFQVEEFIRWHDIIQQ